MKDYSQYGEYTFLKEYLKNIVNFPKTIVDVGAKGVECSNSYNFIKEHRWKAVLIEPEVSNYQGLIDTYLDDEGTIICNVAVADTEGYRDFYLSDIKGHHSLVRKTNKKIKVYTCTLKSILDTVDVDKDFGILDIDAEGMDLIILENFLNTSDYKPRIILHEKGESGKDLFYSLLKSKMYSVIHETKGNIIWGLNEY